jgi:single-strand DNA-binding protein
MNNLNSILIEGNLVKDPELSYTPKGTAVCKFTVACNRAFKQDDKLQKEVSFFDVSTWTRLAEVCGEYLKKGRGVRVVGRLKQDKWTDADGKPHSRVEIVAEHVEFKPQFKKQDGEPASEEDKPAEGAEEEKEDDASKEQEEAKEAVSF